jgi:hypothetical protein
MLRSKRLDDEGVAKLKTPAKRVTIPDPECRGHYVRITPNGRKSFWAVARDPSGKQRWQLIGAADSMQIEDARDKARKIIRSIRAAVGGEIAKDSSFEGVALDWFERHVVKGGLRSERKMGALLKKRIIPPFAGMEFVDVRRKHVTALLDKIEDKHGVRQSDYALSIISGICGWYAKRDEDYASLTGLFPTQLLKRSPRANCWGYGRTVGGALDQLNIAAQGSSVESGSVDPPRTSPFEEDH